MPKPFGQKKVFFFKKTTKNIGSKRLVKLHLAEVIRKLKAMINEKKKLCTARKKNRILRWVI